MPHEYRGNQFLYHCGGVKLLIVFIRATFFEKKIYENKKHNTKQLGILSIFDEFGILGLKFR